jgi:hypothetical protein
MLINTLKCIIKSIKKLYKKTLVYFSFLLLSPQLQTQNQTISREAARLQGRDKIRHKDVQGLLLQLYV